MPFYRDGAIDLPALRNFVDFVIAGGTGTVMLTYGDSLFSILTDDEVAEVTRVVAEQAAGRALVIAADRQWATPKEVEFAQFALSVGADMLMVLPPDWASSCTVETLVEHYAAVADCIPVMVVTNYFVFRSNDFGLSVLTALADRVPGVAAVKDDVCGQFAREMGLAVHDRLALISGGQKQNHMNAHFYGCDGYLSTFVKFKPEIANTYWQAVQAKQYDRAHRIIAEQDMPLFDLLRSFTGGFNAALHGTLELFGVAQRWRRTPYYSLTDQEMERMAEFYRAKEWL
jgi:4-hydroxy-tetrahydrodipicolinate synthase